MKRVRRGICLLFSAVFALLFLPSGNHAAQTVPEGWTGIYSRADLERINTDPDGQYILMNDLDLSDGEWASLCSRDLPFTGTFDGNGHTVYGMTVADSSEPCGFFASVDGGTVRALTVSGTSTGSIAGLLAGTVCNGSVIDCSVRGTVTSSFFAGGMIGQVRGEGVTLSGCVSQATVTGTGSAQTELFAGGLCGAVYGTEISVASCEFSGSLSPVGSLLSVGGMAGEAEGTVLFTDCGTEGGLSLTVTGSAFVGGITGRVGSGVSFLRCAFRADWAPSGCGGVLSLGGICGRILGAGEVSVHQCVAYGSLSVGAHPDYSYSSREGDYLCVSCGVAQAAANHPAYVGGIVGASVACGGTVSVSQCSSFLSLSATGSPVVLGGVVGLNRSDLGTALVEDCYADGVITYPSVKNGDVAPACGGIVGVNGGCSTATLRRCFSACEMKITYPLADGIVVGISSVFYEKEDVPETFGEVFVTDCYYPAGNREFFATPLLGNQLSDPASYNGFDFTSVWTFDPTSGLPRLISADGGGVECPAGDVDGNGRLTEYDGKLLILYLTGSADLSPAQAARADMDGDGTLTARDVSLILRNIL